MANVEKIRNAKAVDFILNGEIILTVICRNKKEVDYICSLNFNNSILINDLANKYFEKKKVLFAELNEMVNKSLSLYL